MTTIASTYPLKDQFTTINFSLRELVLYKFFSVVAFHTSPTILAFVCLFINLLS